MGSRGTLARQALRLNAAMPLVLFTDDSKRDWAAAASALPKASIVIVRARDTKGRSALAEKLTSAVAARKLRLLIADDPGLAEVLGAAGLHLPQRRAREAMHWRVRHPDWIITASAHSLKALMAAREVDAVFLSPVFATASHPGASALGPLRAAFIAAASLAPVYALGGVTAQTAPRLAPAFAGIAAISALSPG